MFSSPSPSFGTSLLSTVIYGACCFVTYRCVCISAHGRERASENERKNEAASCYTYSCSSPRSKTSSRTRATASPVYYKIIQAVTDRYLRYVLSARCFVTRTLHAFFFTLDHWRDKLEGLVYLSRPLGGQPSNLIAIFPPKPHQAYVASLHLKMASLP